MTRRGTDVPTRLPTPEQAIFAFQAWFNQPCPIINGLRPIELFKAHGLENAYVVGSAAWQPILYGEHYDNRGDIDVVFTGADSRAVEFVEFAHGLITRADTTNDKELLYDITVGVFDNPKIIRSWKAGNNKSMERHVISAYCLRANASIAEHVLEYPKEHQRCAIALGAGPGEAWGVTRLVRRDQHSYETRIKKERAERVVSVGDDYDFGGS